MVELIRDYENGILTVVGNVKFDDTGDFLVRMDKLQQAIDLLKEKVRETLTDEWIEISESKDNFMEQCNEDEQWEAQRQYEREIQEEWDGDDTHHINHGC